MKSQITAGNARPGRAEMSSRCNCITFNNPISINLQCGEKERGFIARGTKVVHGNCTSRVLYIYIYIVLLVLSSFPGHLLRFSQTKQTAAQLPQTRCGNGRDRRGIAETRDGLT